MVNYNNGKIYKIEPICEHEEGEIYIGSTTKQHLSQRMTAHRSDYKKWRNGMYHKVTSFDLFDKYGIENCKIILLEEINASSNDELKAREAHYIKSVMCVNKYVPLRTAKEWRNDNKEILISKKKAYIEANKDLIKEQAKSRENRRKKEKYICQCGSCVRKENLQNHKKTVKHIQYVESLTN